MSQNLVFTDAFDYNARVHRNDLDHDVDAARAMISRLRLDALLFDKIVFTDVQIIHSLFLSGLTDLSFRHDPIFSKIPFQSIEIRTKESDLETSILSRVCGTGEHLNPHLFTYIDPTNEILAPAFMGTSTSSVRSLADLAKLLKSATNGTSAAERARVSIAGWERWIAISKDPKSGLRCEQWNPSFKFIDALKIQLDKLVDATLPSDDPFITEGWVPKIRTGSVDRGKVVSTLLLEMSHRNMTEEEYSSLVLAETLLCTAYNRTAAIQHGCTASDATVHYLSAKDKSPVNWGMKEVDRWGVYPTNAGQLSEHFLVALGDMPTNEFANFLSSRVNKKFVMWEAKSRLTLKALCEDISEAADKLGLSAEGEAARNKKISATMPGRRAVGIFLDTIYPAICTLAGAALPSNPFIAAVAMSGLGSMFSTLKCVNDSENEDYALSSLVDFSAARMNWNPVS